MTRTGPTGGQERLLGVIGYPVAHSLSPAMHTAAFRHQNMRCHYQPFAVRPENLAAAVDGIRALGISGVNVTIGHKEAVLPLLDEVAPTARQVGAVNTIVNRGGRLIGYNTDGWGFICSLEEAGIRPAGMEVVILGAGGAARAVATHLAMARCRRITVSNRTRERADLLVQAVQSVSPDLAATAVEQDSAAESDALSRADLVVNCTPQGMVGEWVLQSPLRAVEPLPPHAVVYDTVYRPAETLLLRHSRARGLRTIGGLGMLVHQGACAWEYWFGRRGPVSVMYAAAIAALEGNE